MASYTELLLSNKALSCYDILLTILFTSGSFTRRQTQSIRQLYLYCCSHFSSVYGRVVCDVARFILGLSRVHYEIKQTVLTFGFVAVYTVPEV